MKSLTLIRAPRRTARFRMLAPFAAGLMLLAACGDNGGSSDQSSGGSGGSDLKGSPITIGVMVDETSPGGGTTQKPTVAVAQAWAEHTNEEGGIAGHPVKLEVKDTRGDAPTATTIAQDFIADTSVVAILTASSATETAVGPVLGQADLPVSGVGYNPKVWSALPNFYSVTSTFPTLLNFQVASAKEVGAKKFAELACAEDPSCSASVPIIQAGLKQAGIGFAGTLKIAATAPNYTAECLKLNEDKVDFAQLAMSGGVAARLATDCQKQGYKGYFGASAGSVAPVLYNTPNIRLAGGLNAFPWWGTADPIKNYVSVMKDQGVAEDDYSNPTSTGMWAAAELLRAALSGVTESGDVTRDAVQKGYASLKDEDLDGLLPAPVTFTAGQPAPPVSCYWLYSFDGGKFSGGEKPSCDPAS